MHPAETANADCKASFQAVRPGTCTQSSATVLRCSVLPAAVGLQIKAARSLKRLLTGRLSSPVSSYPVFPGNEANYLRAQVRVWGWATAAAVCF